MVELAFLGTGSISFVLHTPRSIEDTKRLEEALEPLKLLANVGRAKINLTPGAKMKPGMVADAKMLEDSMMREGRRDEVDLSTYAMKLYW